MQFKKSQISKTEKAKKWPNTCISSKQFQKGQMATIDFVKQDPQSTINFAAKLKN